MSNPEGINQYGHGGGSEKIAARQFQSALLTAANKGALTFHHESPGNQSASIRHGGLQGDSVFATINKPSGFVTGPKTKVEFKVPGRHLLSGQVNVTPDMRYHGNDQPHLDLLREHSGINGADVSVSGPIPASWITNITVTGLHP